MKDNTSIDPQTLSTLFPLNLMTNAERELLSDQLMILKGKKGKILIECGDSDNKALYIVSGKIKKESEEGEAVIYEDGSPEYKNPISFSIPHKCTVSCLSTVEYFRLENHIIANLLERKNERRNAPKLTDENNQHQDNPLFTAIYNDLNNDRLVIPTLPKIAMAVRKAIENDEKVRKIEVLIQSDPSLAALLIKTANSALYRTRNSASTIEQAIMRMGLRTVKHLVIGYSLKNLFETKHKTIKHRMKQLWIDSTEVAAVSYVLATHLPIYDPEQALLMGLLHNVGILPILSYAEQYPDISNDEEKLENAIENLSAEVGAIILNKWQFSEEFISVAKESGNWYRNESDTGDYTDLILVARLHTYIARKQHDKETLQLYKIPAFHKLGLDKYDPEKGLSIISDANAQLSEVRSLLAMH